MGLCRLTTMKGRDFMDALGHLEKMLLNGEITESEYKKKKALYVETLLEMFIKDIITEEELKEKLNK